MILDKHDAHVLEFRLRNKALWLAPFDQATRKRRLHELADQKGFRAAARVEEMMEPILDERQRDHASRVESLRAVLG